jgi:hypothetical protein
LAIARPSLGSGTGNAWETKKFDDLLCAAGTPPVKPPVVPDDRPVRDERRPRPAQQTDPDPVLGPAPIELRAAPPSREPGAPPPLQDVDAIARQILVAVSIATVPGSVSVRLEVTTARLSMVRVELSVARGALSARFAVRDPATARVLEGLLPALEAALQQRGLRIGVIDVARGASDGPQRDAKQGRGGEGGRRRQGPPRR